MMGTPTPSPYQLGVERVSACADEEHSLVSWSLPHDFLPPSLIGQSRSFITVPHLPQVCDITASPSPSSVEYSHAITITTIKVWNNISATHGLLLGCPSSRATAQLGGREAVRPPIPSLKRGHHL